MLVDVAAVHKRAVAPVDAVDKLDGTVFVACVAVYAFVEVGATCVVVAVTLEGVDVVAGDGKALVVPGLEALVVRVELGTCARG